MLNLAFDIHDFVSFFTDELLSQLFLREDVSEGLEELGDLWDAGKYRFVKAIKHHRDTKRFNLNRRRVFIVGSCGFASLVIVLDVLLIKLDEVLAGLFHQVSLRKVIGEAQESLVLDHKVDDLVQENSVLGQKHVLIILFIEAKEQVSRHIPEISHCLFDCQRTTVYFSCLCEKHTPANFLILHQDCDAFHFI